MALSGRKRGGRQWCLMVVEGLIIWQLFTVSLVFKRIDNRVFQQGIRKNCSADSRLEIKIKWSQPLQILERGIYMVSIDLTDPSFQVLIHLH